ncbi:efflux RND transporter periplasmic adaptor subunit, partial [Cribrihabitans sp. XS_ASV171]
AAALRHERLLIPPLALGYVNGAGRAPFRIANDMSIWKQLLILAVMAGVAMWGYETYQRHVAETGAPAAAGAERGSRPATVELARVERRKLARVVEAVGTTRASQSVEIVPEAGGRVEMIGFEAGQNVEEGTVLVQLDDTIARADLAEADAQLVERRRGLDRLNQLRGSSSVSEAAIEQAVARFAEAQAQVDRARQRLAERTIRAPFDGTVGLPEVDNGARVTAGTFITRLDDLSEVEVEFSLPETLFAQIQPSQQITATSAAFPERAFGGKVEAVDSRIDPVSRSFRTRAIIPNPDGTLPAGMFMSLELTLSEFDRLVVPEEAIVFQAAETYVFVVEDGVARRIPVATGQRREGYVAVLTGLEEGAQVVVRGLHRVRDGGAVKPLNADDVKPSADEAES